MSNIDDLLDPLRYNNLGEFELTDVRSIGGGVFVQKDTIQHLEMLDSIIKAYTSIHVPTFGHSIPNTPFSVVTAITDATTTKLLTPAKGEVYRVDNVSILSGESGTTWNLGIQYPSSAGVATLAITSPGEITPLNTEIPTIALSSRPVLVTYPQVLNCTTTSSGSVSTTVIIGYTKLQQ